MKFLRILLLSICLIFGVANAKEPTNWFFGAGIGAGKSQIDKVYPTAAGTTIGITWAGYTPSYSSTVADLGVTWELLGGYKHFVNDWFGLRYYVNIGAQHYKDEVFTAGKVEAGVIDYTANADILVNFWTEELWSIGMFAGLGVGGVYFNSKALDTYKSLYGGTAPGASGADDKELAKRVYAGEGKVYNNHWTALVNLGLRGSYFQKVRDVSKRVCNNREDGRRTCRVPISYYEHSFEFVSRFALTTYKVTDGADFLAGFATSSLNGAQGMYIAGHHRAGYIVKNPYRFTFRYVFAF